VRHKALSEKLYALNFESRKLWGTELNAFDKSTAIAAQCLLGTVHFLRERGAVGFGGVSVGN